jgi:hypothetical protein
MICRARATKRERRLAWSFQFKNRCVAERVTRPIQMDRTVRTSCLSLR